MFLTWQVKADYQSVWFHVTAPMHYQGDQVTCVPPLHRVGTWSATGEELHAPFTACDEPVVLDRTQGNRHWVRQFDG